jgi:hypothetical protein
VSDTEPELWQTVPASEVSNNKKGLVKSFKKNPAIAAALVGAVFSAILPLIVVIWKIDLCNIGPGDDISGVFVCIPPFMALGAAIGAVFGAFVNLLRKRTNNTNPGSIGTVIACVLAAIASVLISTVPAFMLAFPDC